MVIAASWVGKRIIVCKANDDFTKFQWICGIIRCQSSYYVSSPNLKVKSLSIILNIRIFQVYERFKKVVGLEIKTYLPNYSSFSQLAEQFSTFFSDEITSDFFSIK